MGHVWIDAEIFDLQKMRSKRIKGLADTGATLTTIPQSLANELGIEVISEEKVETGAGLIKIKKGRAIIKIKEKEEVQAVWISDVIDRVLIGSVTFEVLGFKLDPVTGKLEERPLMLY